MILNVRGCSSMPGIIITYLIENEEETGYDSFNAKKIVVKNKTDILAAIKKTLVSSREFSEIRADDFVSTINSIGKKSMFVTSLKAIVKAINEENVQPLPLSQVYFDNKALPQIKAINIVNKNMYFMIKMGPNYTLELIKKEKIKCVIAISSLVNLYRQIKQTKPLPKNNSKKYYKPKTPVAESIWRSTIERVSPTTIGCATDFREGVVISPAGDYSRRVKKSAISRKKVTVNADLARLRILPEASVDIIPNRQQTEQINQSEEAGELSQTPQPEITDTVKIIENIVGTDCLTLETQETERNLRQEMVREMAVPEVAATEVAATEVAATVEEELTEDGLEVEAQETRKSLKRGTFVEYLRNHHATTFNPSQENRLSNTNRY